MKTAKGILLVGSTGRMGAEIKKLIDLDRNFHLVAEVGRGVNEDFSSLLKDQIDLVLDFSQPPLFEKALDWSLKNSKAFVSGTTGLSEAQRRKLSGAGENIPVLWAANMSLGIAALKKAIKVIPFLEGFDIQLSEMHHRHKKDQPSGTAIDLQQSIEADLGKALPPIQSTRGGGVFGVHKVLASSDEELLSFEHTALSRAVFARGALRAAQWIQGKPAGIYLLADVLELK